MPILASFPHVARLIADALAPVGTVVGETDLDLQQHLQGGGRVIRVRRIGGNDDRITDAARVDIDVYAIDLGVAETGAELARQRLISGPVTTSQGVLDRADTEVAPHETPSPDPASYRVVSATYRISVRRR